MRSTKFYPTRLVSSLVLLLLLMNVFSAFAQNTGPNIISPSANGCIDHNPGTVGSIYTYSFNSAVSSTPTWTVKGDIQLLNAAGTVVSSLTDPTARIRSTAGYGKGRLIATYDQAPPCGAKQEYVDVYKTFSLFDEWPAGVSDNDSKNRIIGPTCLSAVGTYTYSINSVLSVNQNQEIGIDSYTWDYPASWTDSSSITKYISGDKSSITFAYPANFADGDVLKVSVGKCNPVQYTIALYKAVPKPAITPLASCVPTTTTAITLSVQNPNNTDYAYDWILPTNSNWYFTDGSDGKDRIQANITIDNSTFDVKVVARRRNSVANDACNSTESQPLTIKRALPAGSVISGPSGLPCVNGSAYHTYTVNGATGAFKWTFTPATGSTGEGFSVPNPSGSSVSFKAGTLGGVLSVASADPACPGSVTLNIVSNPAQPLAITGPACVNANSTGVGYSIAPVPGATSYTWTPTGGISISTPSTGTSVTVNVGSTGGSLSVRANNGTCQSLQRQTTISLNPVAPTSITANQSCINRTVSDTLTFSVANPIAGQTYDWQVIYPTGVTSGWTVLTGSATNGGSSITYRTNGIAGTYRVEARAIRAGCSSVTAWVSSANIVTARSITVTKNVFTDPDTGDNVHLLVATSISGATYVWTRTHNGVTTTLSAKGSTLDLNTLGDINNKANYCATAIVGGCTTNTFCVESEYNEPSTTGAARVSSSQTSPEQLSSQVIVYPNPTSNGEFTLQLPAFKGQASVVLKNLQGQVVYKTEVSKTKSKLSAGKLSSGVYLLQVSLEGKVVTKKVTVKK